jgi:glycerol-3-phosphate cytidylyltransferase
MRVYNGGTYDQLHPGHLFAFRQMRELAGPRGEVIIGLNTDAFVERFKGHPTVQRLAERMEILAALRLVDRVVVNTGDEDSRSVLEAVMPEIIAVGHDWFSDDDSRYCAQMGFTREWLRDRGIQLHYMRFLPGHSSTRLRTIAGGMS